MNNNCCSCKNALRSLPYASVIAVSTVLFLLNLSIHEVKEGHVAVYYRGGALLENTSQPGFHLMIPFVTSFCSVQTILKIDEVTDVPCDTLEGVTIFFGQIDVGSILDKEAVHDVVKNFTMDFKQLLIVDKLIHELNIFCASHTLREVYIDLFNIIGESLKNALQKDLSKMAPGLRVRAVWVARPKIPETFQIHFNLLEEEKSKLLFIKQKQKRIEKEAEIEGNNALLQAEKSTEIAKIRHEQLIIQKIVQKRISVIEEKMSSARAISLANAELYTAKLKAAGSKLKFTVEFLEHERVRILSLIEKVYYGPSIPYITFDPNREEEKRRMNLTNDLKQRINILQQYVEFYYEKVLKSRYNTSSWEDGLFSSGRNVSH